MCECYQCLNSITLDALSCYYTAVICKKQDGQKNKNATHLFVAILVFLLKFINYKIAWN